MLPFFRLVVPCATHKPNTVGGGGCCSTSIPPSLVAIKPGRAAPRNGHVKANGAVVLCETCYNGDLNCEAEMATL